MADSNSLILLPPRQTAQAPADNSTRKTDKPSKNHSFGQKLDKAKKAILVTATKIPVKAAPQTKGIKDAAPTKQTADEEADQSTDATDQTAPDPSKIKLPTKPVAKNLKQVDAVENPDQQKPEEGDATAVKQVTPVKAPADRPRKTARATSVVKNPANAKNTDSSTTQVAPQAVTATNTENSSDDDASDADPDNDADSTDTIAAANTQQFGTGKLINHNSLTGANADAANGANDSADQQQTTAAAVNAVDPVATAAAELTTTVEATTAKSLTAISSHSTDATTDTASLAATPTTQHATTVSVKAAAEPAASPQVQFAEDNHPKIVTGIQGQLMPNGGTLQLQLNPASLGALQVTVHIADGVVTASFETSNDDATKLLSHSLGQLKAGLEAAGVSVDKLHVEQAPQRDTSNDSGGSDSKQAMQDQQKNAQQDQQRREMVQKMWRRLAGGSDPLDLVA